MLRCCRVVVAQWSELRQLRSEALGSIPSGYPSFFLQYVSILIYQQFLLPEIVMYSSTDELATTYPNISK